MGKARCNCACGETLSILHPRDQMPLLGPRDKCHCALFSMHPKQQCFMPTMIYHLYLRNLFTAFHFLTFYSGQIKKLKNTPSDNSINDSNNNDMSKAHRYTMQLERQIRDLMAVSRETGQELLPSSTQLTKCDTLLKPLYIRVG